MRRQTQASPATFFDFQVTPAVQLCPQFPSPAPSPVLPTKNLPDLWKQIPQLSRARKYHEAPPRTISILFAEQNTKNSFSSLPGYTHVCMGMAKSWRPKPCTLNFGNILRNNTLAAEFSLSSQTVFIKMVSTVAQNFGANKYLIYGH